MNYKKLILMSLPGALALSGPVQAQIAGAPSVSPVPMDDITDGPLLGDMKPDVQRNIASCLSGYAAGTETEKKEWRELADFFKPESGPILMMIEGDQVLFTHRNSDHGYGWSTSLLQAARLNKATDEIRGMPARMRPGLIICLNPGPRQTL